MRPERCAAVASPTGSLRNFSHVSRLEGAGLESVGNDLWCVPFSLRRPGAHCIAGALPGGSVDSSSFSHPAAPSMASMGPDPREECLWAPSSEEGASYPSGALTGDGTRGHSIAVPSRPGRSRDDSGVVGPCGRPVPPSSPAGNPGGKPSLGSRCHPTPSGLSPPNAVVKLVPALTPLAQRGGRRWETCGPGHPSPPMGLMPGLTGSHGPKTVVVQTTEGYCGDRMRRQSPEGCPAWTAGWAERSAAMDKT